MRRPLPAMLLSVGLVRVLAAEPQAPATHSVPAAERVRQFQRNCELIETLVQSGLRLAAEEDSVKRAEFCTEMAERIAGEIRRAVQNAEKERVVELADHLQSVLSGGVAANLTMADKQLPSGSSLARNLQQARDRAVDVVKRLEEELRSSRDAGDSQELQHTLTALDEGRREVEQAVQNEGPGPKTR